MARTDKTFAPKDPEAGLVYQRDWTAELGENTILTSVWTIIPQVEGDETLVASDDSIIGPANTVTQVKLSGGTAGRYYLVENKITISGSPGQTDERSFKLPIKER